MKKLYRGEAVEVLEQSGSLSKIVDSHGNEFSVRTEKLKDIKPTKAEKYADHVGRIRLSSTAYEFAGWVASHKGLLHVSTPQKDLDKVEDILASHLVAYTLGSTLTLSTDKTTGWSISVVVEKPSLDLEAAGIHATAYFETGKVSTQTRQFCLEFLLDDLKFQLGDAQDIAIIRSRVPEQFKADFERGVTA